MKIVSYGNYINVQENYHAIYNRYTGSNLEGTVRYNFTTNLLEVFDGSTWTNYNKEFYVDLTDDAHLCLTWVKQKMQEEQELKKLIEKHPELKDQYEKFQILHALVKDHE